MSKHAFTRGPWRVEENTTLIWGKCNPDDQSNQGMGYPIAECRITPISLSSWATGPSEDEGEANARLMAAAPDMIEALTMVRDNMRKGVTGAEARKAWDLANAAIAKATGGSDA